MQSIGEAASVFGHICSTNPEVAILFQELLEIREELKRNPVEKCCGNQLWICYFKPHIEIHIGKYAIDPFLKNSEAYETLEMFFRKSLPPCNGCSCPNEIQ
jgi:hypothetical protein